MRLCLWSLALASNILVLGLERVCPWKGCPWPWPRIIFVSLALASSLMSSTPPLGVTHFFSVARKWPFLDFPPDFSAYYCEDSTAQCRCNRRGQGAVPSKRLLVPPISVYCKNFFGASRNDKTTGNNGKKNNNQEWQCSTLRSEFVYTYYVPRTLNRTSVPYFSSIFEAYRTNVPYPYHYKKGVPYLRTVFLSKN